MEHDFEQLFILYYEDVLAFVLSRTNANWTLAEEITQETFYQAYLSLHRYRPIATIKTWLCQIALHMLSKYARKRKLELILEEDVNDQKAQSPVSLRITLMDAIQKLDSRSQAIVIARLYFEKSFSLIAQQHKISESSARVICHRARQFLKQELKGVKDEKGM